MDNLEEMSIDELVDMNARIQKVLKEKRKARSYHEEKFGDKVKIEIDLDSDSRAKWCILKMKQRYNADSYITILARNPDIFIKELEDISKSISKACTYIKKEVK